MEKVSQLSFPYYVPDVYPKDLGEVVAQLVETVNELIDRVEQLELTLKKQSEAKAG